VSEEPVMRYRLKEITDVSAGMLLAGGDCVYFDLSQGQNAAAVFYNEKTNDEGESHTSFVRNQIVAE
jgi:hypothetical protein